MPSDLSQHFDTSVHDLSYSPRAWGAHDLAVGLFQMGTAGAMYFLEGAALLAMPGGQLVLVGLAGAFLGGVMSAAFGTVELSGTGSEQDRAVLTIAKTAANPLYALPIGIELATGVAIDTLASRVDTFNFMMTVITLRTPDIEKLERTQALVDFFDAIAQQIANDYLSRPQSQPTTVEQLPAPPDLIFPAP